MKLWRNMSFFVAIPACILMAVRVYLEHQKEHEHPHPRPPFIPYEHLRIRTKRFPWGDGNHSLFHNPHANALPDGYEDEEH
jgi:cytochrome c oxidase subunit 6a